ncbi:BTB/POZ domain-containing protein 2-like [Paramacrobiotus metropolitanus]|uniref:BTB/POZ domain-containing protein 2-like n=1 Tax=Paramacrobiotus metropolitanus TaxID=2943436 RepID=UPI0024462173|nr:BTB/POZ domain-containing protein 2-like [Paramacrobiotus metropolitanus]
MASTNPPSSTVPAARLNSRIKQTLATGELSDVRFSVGRDCGPQHVQVFPAHKYMVSIRSTVFHAMFYGSVPETGPQVDIPDCMPDAFANMLSFMYTESVENLGMENVIVTMRCADKYDLPQLTSQCLDFIDSQLCPDNCLILLEEAINGRQDGVVEKCLQLVEVESAVILQSEEFTSIALDTLKLILQRNALSAEENIIYMAVERWAVEACNQQNLESTTANRRAVLGEALFLVRFPLLTGAQLAEGPGKSGSLLLDKELLSIFLYQNGAVTTPLPFPMEYRAAPVLRRNPTTFEPGEEMFALSASGYWWQAATIIRWRASRGVEVRWCHSGEAGCVEAEKVVRAADILTSGRTVYCLTPQGPSCDTYVRPYPLGRGLHQVLSRGREAYAPFSMLALHAVDVDAWMAARDVR